MRFTPSFIQCHGTFGRLHGARKSLIRRHCAQPPCVNQGARQFGIPHCGIAVELGCLLKMLHGLNDFFWHMTAVQ